MGSTRPLPGLAHREEEGALRGKSGQSVRRRRDGETTYAKFRSVKRRFETFRRPKRPLRREEKDGTGDEDCKRGR